MCTESGAERPAVNPNPEVMMSSTRRDQARQARRALADIPAQLAALEKMSVAELREKWQEAYGQPTTAGNKAYLKKRLAWRIQELAEGGLSDRAKARIEELVADAPIRWRAPKPDAGGANGRDPRLPEPGAVITRSHGGIDHHVTVLDDGFEYAGERYDTLSRVAKVITGAHWNGYLFFDLKQRPPRRGSEAGA
jgi:hypothetical protein